MRYLLRGKSLAIYFGREKNAENILLYYATNEAIGENLLGIMFPFKAGCSCFKYLPKLSFGSIYREITSKRGKSEESNIDWMLRNLLYTKTAVKKKEDTVLFIICSLFLQKSLLSFREFQRTYGNYLRLLFFFSSSDKNKNDSNKTM